VLVCQSRNFFLKWSTEPQAAAWPDAKLEDLGYFGFEWKATNNQPTLLFNRNTMKATQPLLKRISRQALNTKMTNKGYYKGTGTGSMGRHTKHGGYKIEWDKVRTYVVPKDLKDFKVNL